MRARSGEPFVLGGDSGSPVVAEDGSAAVGVLFAGNPNGEYAYIIPMPTVVGLFGGGFPSWGLTVCSMSPDEAAVRLESEFRRFPWFISVGTGLSEKGRPVLYLYVKSARHKELARLKTGWSGFDVAVRAIGGMRPLNTVRINSPF